MSALPAPGDVCAVDGCDQPAVVTARSPDTLGVTDSLPGELVPLCAIHAEQADAPGVEGKA